MANKRRVLAFIVFLFWARSALAQDTIQISMGPLTTAVVGPLLKKYAASYLPEFSRLAEIEKRGVSNGMEYDATLANVRMAGVFQNLSNDHYTIAIRNDGLIAIHCDMPDATTSGLLNIKARSDGKGLLDAFDWFGVMHDLTRVDRSYRVSAQGIRFDTLVRVAFENETIVIKDSKISDLRIGETKISLAQDRDALGTAFANFMTLGTIDRMIRDMIFQELNVGRIKKQMIAPIKRMIANGLKIPIHLKLAVSPDVQLVNFGGLKADEMQVSIPITFLEELADTLRAEQSLEFSQTKWGVQYHLSSNGDVRIEGAENNEMVLTVPIQLRLSSKIFSADLTAEAAIRVKQVVYENQGLFLKILDARVENFAGWPLSIGAGTFEYFLARKFRERIRAAFPSGGILVTTLPILENLDWRVKDVNVSSEGVSVKGRLEASCAVPFGVNW